MGVKVLSINYFMLFAVWGIWVLYGVVCGIFLVGEKVSVV